MSALHIHTLANGRCQQHVSSMSATCQHHVSSMSATCQQHVSSTSAEKVGVALNVSRGVLSVMAPCGGNVRYFHNLRRGPCCQAVHLLDTSERCERSATHHMITCFIHVLQLFVIRGVSMMFVCAHRHYLARADQLAGPI